MRKALREKEILVICAQCATQLDADDNFCRKCGKAVTRQPVAQPGDTPRKTRRTRRGPLKFTSEVKVGERVFTEEEWKAGGEEVVTAVAEAIYHQYVVDHYREAAAESHEADESPQE